VGKFEYWVTNGRSALFLFLHLLFFFFKTKDVGECEGKSKHQNDFDAGETKQDLPCSTRCGEGQNEILFLCKTSKEAAHNVLFFDSES